MREVFNLQLQLLDEQMAHMGEVCSLAISNIAEVMLNGNLKKIKPIADSYAEVDRTEREIEKLCLQLFLKQQPVATDLRKISAVHKMVSDMKRIGQQIANIADIFLTKKNVDIIYIQPFSQMAQIAGEMIRNGISAYITGDLSLVEAVIAADNEMDLLYDASLGEIVNYIRLEKGKHGKQALKMAMVANHLEQIGDHARQVAEWAEFSITGVHRKGSALLFE